MSEKTETGPGGEQPLEGSGAGRGWPRRRLLRWALGLVPVAAAGGGWAAFRWLDERERRRLAEEEEGPEDGWEAEGGRARGGPTGEPMSEEARAEGWTRDAIWYCFSGHPSTSINLGQALKALPSYAPARLMRACWSMGKGRWDLAEEDLSDSTFAILRRAGE